MRLGTIGLFGLLGLIVASGRSATAQTSSEAGSTVAPASAELPREPTASPGDLATDASARPHSTRYGSYAVPRGRYRHRGSTAGLVGMSIFSASSGLSIIVGQSMVLGEVRASCSTCNRDGWLLVIPLVGPAVGVGLSDARDARALFAFVGSIELAGLLIAGLASIPRRDRRPDRYYGSDLHVGIGPGTLTFRARF